MEIQRGLISCDMFFLYEQLRAAKIKCRLRLCSTSFANCYVWIGDLDESVFPSVSNNGDITYFMNSVQFSNTTAAYDYIINELDLGR